MKTPINVRLLAVLLVTVAVSPLHAQLVADGATNTLSNVTTNITGDVTVGTNGSFTLLILSDNALLTNSANGVIGRNATANSNQVRLISASARWLMGPELNVGLSGSGNRLVVSNGGVVQCGGSGSVGRNASSANNEAIVTGAGSLWANDSSLAVGNSGGTNRLVVTNGGSVRNFLGYIGLLSGDNEARVTGAGSSWTNLGTLQVGRFASASRNRLVVSNAGVVFSAVGVIVGTAAGSTNNRVTVDGGTLCATNATGTAALDVRRGTNVLNAGLIDVDQLLLTNTQGFFEFNGGLLVTRGAVISNGAPFVVGTSGTMPAVWDVRAGVTNTFVGGDLIIGSNSSFNQLILTNGALLTNSANSAYGTLGRQFGANSNCATIAGAGSRWFLDDGVFVGSFGSGNRLVVSNGAALVTGSSSVIGNEFVSTNNEAVVTGPGSSWTSGPGQLFVGGGGRDNRLLVSDGAQVLSFASTIGDSFADSSNNLAVVTGAGSLWSNQSDLYVGFNGARNQLLVTNSAWVVSSNGFLGFNASSLGNVAMISGAGSVWSNRADVYVGNSGSANQLIVSNGGRVMSRIGYVGFGVNSRSNLVLVTGFGSAWSNYSSFYFGVSGAGNQLVVSNGGLLQTSQGEIGQFAASTNNEVVITGAGSRWHIPNSPLVVGDAGSGNRLVVSDDGSVFDRGSVIGFLSGSSNNEVLVTGDGYWSTDFLRIGVSGSGNRLVITNGGRVLSRSYSIVGENASSTNNRVVVDGGSLRSVHFSGLNDFDVRRGTNVLNAGLIELDRLLLTNSAGRFEFNGGTLTVKNSTIGNGQLFRVGNGVSPATFTLAGNGFHSFGNGLSISANSMLTGNGTLSGGVVVLSGGKLSPGASIGKMVLSNSPSLQGAVIMEISKNGAALTNDQIQVLGALTYGGSLTVSNLGPTALAIGNRFPLFSANSYAGAFSVVSLPSLPPGLNWTNKLLVDGSIEVIAVPKFTGVLLSGTNLIFSGTGGTPNAPYAVLTATNVVLPLSNWVSIATNQFDSSGNFAFTNAVAPGIPQRFFRLRVP